MQKAITIIKDEHRALAAVLNGLQYLVEQIRGGDRAPDFALMKSMLNYVELFPDKLHHPKEDEYVYRVLRQREPTAAATLDQLEDEHQRGPALIREVVDALEAFERDPGAFDGFARAVTNYANFQWKHMRTEEEVILPLAEKSLQSSDWEEINTAFASNDDPMVGVGTRNEFRDLFRRIVNLMPPPMGVGPERT